MRVVAIQQYGGPEVLQAMDLPTPQPAAGEVRVQVHAVSINPVDLITRAGPHLHLPLGDFPVVLGWDISGVVDALGEGVSDFAVGDPVFGMIRFPKAGWAYVEAVTTPVTDITLKPQELGHAEAAAMGMAALIAQQALDTMQLRAGQTVLVHGAAGGVGHFAVQLAKARGARVVATASAKDREVVMQLGADQVIDYHGHPFEEQVSGVDAVLVTVGGDTLDRSFGVVKPGGRLISLIPQFTDGDRQRARGEDSPTRRQNHLFGPCFVRQFHSLG